MKFKKIASLIMVLILCITLTGCGSKNESQFGRFEDFNNTVIGVKQGKAHDEYIASRLENVDIKYYVNNTEMVEDLEKGRIDACVLDKQLADYYDSLKTTVSKFPSSIADTKYSLLTSNSFSLYDETYDVISNMIDSGELEELQNKWFSCNNTIMRIAVEDYTNYPTYKGTLKVIADSKAAPASYIDRKGTIQGYEIELIYRIAKALNMEVQIDTTDEYDVILDSINNDKYDIAAGFVITDDEKTENGQCLQNIAEGGAYLLVETDRLKKNEKKKNDIMINNLEDLEGKRVGILAGSVFESFLYNREVSTVNKYYSNNEDMLKAVQNGDIAGAVIDKGIAKNFCDKNADATYINVDKIEYGFIFDKNNEYLTNQFNQFLQKITMNGTLKRINNTWLNGEEENKIIVDYRTLPAVNGTLKLATSTTLEPYSYKNKNGEPCGLDIELAILFCEENGYALEIVDGTFDEVLKNVNSGKCDFGGAAVIKTAERQAQFRFSDSTFTGGISLVILAENTAVGKDVKQGYTISDQFYNVFVDNDNWLLLLAGMGITIAVGVLSIILGSFLGTIISMEYVSAGQKMKKAIEKTSKVFLVTPIVIWLSILAHLFFRGRFDTGIVIGVLAFSICYGFDIFGTAKKVYWKFTNEDKANGYNLNLNEFYSFFYICFTRYYDDIFEDYKVHTVRVFKNTTLLGLIYAFDFAYACDYVRMNSFVSWLPILLMFVFYFSIDMLIAQLVERIKLLVSKEKKSAGDFNFGSAAKFSLEDDSENLFRLDIKEGSGTLSKGIVGPVIKYENVTVNYDKKTGLDNVSIDILKGECVAFTGTAKSGITTFFNAMNGFVELKSGKVSVFGKDVSIPENRKKIRKSVSIILRNDQLFPRKNVVENVMYVFYLTQNITKRNAYVQAYKLLFKLGLAKKAFSSESELTISEKKRLLIARALVLSPEILVLDHIEEGLKQNELVELTFILNQIKDSGTTLLIASDDLLWLKTMTTRMLIFDEGKIIDDGSTEALINRPQKPRTIEFVSKSANFNAHITSKLFDHVELAGKIWTFAKNNQLDNDFAQRLEDIVTIIEKEIIVKVMPTAFSLNMKMVYSKALNSVRLNMDYDGNDFDYINSMAVDKYDIFARLVESIHYSYDGANRYEITIPVEKKY